MSLSRSLQKKLIQDSHYPLYDRQGQGEFALPVIPNRRASQIPFYLAPLTRRFVPVRLDDEGNEQKVAMPPRNLSSVELKKWKKQQAARLARKEAVSPGYPLTGRHPETGTVYRLTLYQGATPVVLIERSPKLVVSVLADKTRSVALHRWTPLEEEARLHYFLIEKIKSNPL